MSHSSAQTLAFPGTHYPPLPPYRNSTGLKGHCKNKNKDKKKKQNKSPRFHLAWTNSDKTTKYPAPKGRGKATGDFTFPTAQPTHITRQDLGGGNGGSQG